MDPPTIEVIQHLHYHFSVGDHKGSTQTSTGIKQGCCIAPYLWSYFTTSFLLLLQQRRNLEWILRVLTLFADDCWGSWLIRSAADFDQAREDLELSLETLETLRMNINYQKTAILLKLVGRDASALKHAAVFKKAGVLHLKVSVHGRECGIPIKAEHEYLGSIVSYHRRLDKNMQHRLKACQARYQGLRKTLNGSHHLSQEYRIRLWQACVCTSAFYSQHVVGLTCSTLSRLVTELTRHLRAILRLPPASYPHHNQSGVGKGWTSHARLDAAVPA